MPSPRHSRLMGLAERALLSPVGSCAGLGPYLLSSLAARKSGRRVSSGGVHPAGWAVRSSPAFHATWLAQNSLSAARNASSATATTTSAGDVGVSCVQSGCHTQAPIACTTCHGSRRHAAPADIGAHWAHEAYCSTCHDVPVETTASVQAPRKRRRLDARRLRRHRGAERERLAGRRRARVRRTSWDPTAQHCTNTYCHGALRRRSGRAPHRFRATAATAPLRPNHARVVARRDSDRHAAQRAILARPSRRTSTASST